MDWCWTKLTTYHDLSLSSILAELKMCCPYILENKRPMGLDTLFENQFNLAIGQISEVACTCTGTSFLSHGVEIELIFALWEVVSEIWADFQNCHIWAWNLVIGQSSWSCRYALFLPQGVKIELIFTQRAVVPEIQTHFQIAIFGHKTLQVAKVPHILSFSPRRWNWAYFHSTGSGFRDMGRFWKLPCLGMKLGHWPKFQMLHIYFLNYPRVPDSIPFCSTAGHFQNIGNFLFSH